MSEYNGPPTLPGLFRELQTRLSRLERRATIGKYTTTSRPNAADAQGTIIFNTTTGKHEASDGVTWNVLY